MNIVALPVDAGTKTQVFNIDVKPNDNAQTLRVEVSYRPYVGKYFATVSNVSTGEDILRNFPLVGSVEDGLNDLLRQVSYKLCGAFVCYPAVNKLTFPDPNGTIEEFELLWGDSPWLN